MKHFVTDGIIFDVEEKTLKQKELLEQIQIDIAFVHSFPSLMGIDARYSLYCSLVNEPTSFL